MLRPSPQCWKLNANCLYSKSNANSLACHEPLMYLRLKVSSRSLSLLRSPGAIPILTIIFILLPQPSPKPCQTIKTPFSGSQVTCRVLKNAFVHWRITIGKYPYLSPFFITTIPADSRSLFNLNYAPLDKHTDPR